MRSEQEPPTEDVRLHVVRHPREGAAGAVRPEWAARVLAAVAAAGTHGEDHLDDVDRNLLLAVEARIRYRLGEPGPEDQDADHWRDRAFAATHRALDKLRTEPPAGGRVFLFPGPDHRER